MLGTGSTAQSVEVAELKDMLGITGTARSSFFTKDTSFVDAPGVQNDSLWITARPHDIVGIKSYFDARVQGQFVSGNSKISGDLREGYLEKTLGQFDIKVGRQIVVWGRADKINPTDSWSIRNYRLLVTDDDDQRVGAAAAQVVWNVGAEHVIAIWQPEWRFPVLPIPPLPPGTSLTNLSASKKVDQLGLKFDHSGAGVDWSVSYAHAINRTPDLALLDSQSFGIDPGLRPRETKLGLTYNFAEVFGADAAVPVGKYGLRGEVAYTHARNSGGHNPLAQDSNLFAVLGIERTWEGALNVNVQYLFKRSFDYRGLDSIADPSVRLLAQQAELISNQLASNMQGAALRVDYKAFNETLETEIAAVMWFKKTDSIVTAKVSYAFTDRIKGILGANVLSGPTDSFFGRLRRTSTAFFEVRFAL
ncbi:MAG TPA: DUF1302 family protein [Opitutaceae bacterium]|nr:DUF1302 family protein [Opitutaceae bacterium]